VNRQTDTFAASRGKRSERWIQRRSCNGLIHPSRRSGINAVLVCVCDPDNLERHHSRSWRRRTRRTTKPVTV